LLDVNCVPDPDEASPDSFPWTYPDPNANETITGM
jgi:hypothetical protein